MGWSFFHAQDSLGCTCRKSKNSVGHALPRTASTKGEAKFGKSPSWRSLLSHLNLCFCVCVWGVKRHSFHEEAQLHHVVWSAKHGPTWGWQHDRTSSRAASGGPRGPPIPVRTQVANHGQLQERICTARVRGLRAHLDKVKVWPTRNVKRLGSQP